MKKDKKLKEAQVPRTVDRFDLEQQIMQCWSMVDDLRAFANSGADTDELRALSKVYDRKFDILFETFSTMISEGQFAEHIRQTPQI
jgi:hypothetical protein